jgi:hypothetical protein
LAFLPIFTIIYVPLALIVSFPLALPDKNFPQKKTAKTMILAGIN